MSTRPARTVPARAGATAAGLFVLALAAGCAPAAPRGPAPRAPTLAQVVDSVVNTPPLDRTQWGILFYDPGADSVVYALNSGRQFIPASNTKLMTTAAAVGELGSDFRFLTDLYVVDPEAGDSVAASLLLVAHGDPSMSSRFFQPDGTAPLDSLADSLALAGFRRVTGDLVVDASYFDDQVWQSSWSWGWEGGGFAAPVAAFDIDEGLMGLRVAAGATPGEPGSVEVLEAPEGAVVLDRLRTGPPAPEGSGEEAARPGRRRGGRGVRVTGRPGSDTLVVEGVVPAGAQPWTMHRAVGDPALFAAHALAEALRSRGIELEGGVRVVYQPVATEGEGAPSMRRVALWHSPPLMEIVAGLLKPSQNWIAEHLAKTLGAERGDGGTWRDGTAAIEHFLFEEAGVDSGSVSLHDGSGLSSQNVVAPTALVRLLAYIQDQPWGEAYREGLPSPGGDGTLRNRLEGLEGRVHAKTGTVSNVNALSGYLTTSDGHELIFSILTNGSGRPSSQVREGIDRIVQAAAAR